MPESVNRPWSSVLTGRGQARRPSGGSPEARRRRSRRVGAAPTLRTRTSTPCGRLTGHVDQPAVDDLLGPELDLGRGLLGVGVELGPAEADPGARGQGVDREERADAVRDASRRKRPSPSDGPWPSRACRVDLCSALSHGRAGSPDHVDAAPCHRLAVGVEHAAGDGHPCRGGGIGSRRRSGRSTCGARPADRPVVHGLVLHRQGVGKTAGAGGDGGERATADIAVSFSLWINMDLSTSWARAAAGRERPAGGCTGREGDRGPGRGVAQEGMRRTPRRAGAPGPRPARRRAGRRRGGSGRGGASRGPGQPAAERCRRAIGAVGRPRRG